MRVIILGSAAGGGVPQWNCGCRNCTEARHTNRSRTQSSVAVSADGERWILLNASPDLRTQLAAHRSLWPPSGSRATPVRAVVLTDGEIDHTLGLLLLRESADRLPVYAPAGVTALLGDEWPLYRVLSAYSGVEPRAIEEGRPIALTARAGPPTGICCSATAVARRPPRYARAAPTQAFDVGMRLTDGRAGGTLAYGPTAGAMDDAVRHVAGGADLLFFDGTFWSDDELRAAGVAAPTAREMGHLPIGGPGGSLELLPQLDAKRVVLVHLNNTNPILCRSSAERARGEAGGIEAWLRLGEAMGVKREDLVGQRFLLPGVRFAVDAYVNFCRFRPWLEAVAASLTEMFAPLIVKERLAAMLSHYKWVDPAGLQYFKNRLTQAPRDAEYALGLVTERLRTPEEQGRAVAALEFKCDVLWCLLDAVERGPLPGTVA